MKKLFRSRNRKLNEKIQALRQEREVCTQRIRALRAEMDALVQRAVNADDLDQKLLSLDYSARKGSLNVETERFQDLSCLIKRMQDIQAMNTRNKRIEYIASVRDGIDEAAMRRAADEVEARRAMMEEEEAFSAPYGAILEPGDNTFVPDSEFSCLITQARLKQKSESKQPLPACADTVAATV